MTGGRVDPAIVRRHLFALDAAVQNLRKHRGKTVESLRTDRDTLWSVERGLQLCAQNVLDIATHLAAAAGHDAPDYAAALDELGRMGVLPAEFLSRFRGIAGFRNVLVHAYLEVDPARVHELLNERLDDFVQFSQYVETHLARQS